MSFRQKFDSHAKLASLPKLQNTQRNQRQTDQRECSGFRHGIRCRIERSKCRGQRAVISIRISSLKGVEQSVRIAENVKVAGYGVVVIQERTRELERRIDKPKPQVDWFKGVFISNYSGVTIWIEGFDEEISNRYRVRTSNTDEVHKVELHGNSPIANVAVSKGAEKKVSP